MQASKMSIVITIHCVLLLFYSVFYISEYLIPMQRTNNILYTKSPEFIIADNP